MSSEDESHRSSKISKKPRYSRFTQQELPACKPILTPGWVISILISIALVFIPIGLLSFSASESVVEVVDRYDDACAPSNGERVSFIQNSESNKTCIRTLLVPKKMKSPIYVYYQLDNFYQNHRRYVKSRSDHQLWSPKDEFYTKLCEPEAGTDNKPIVPCGLIAWSLFNDTYKLSRNDAALDINKKDIAWRSDRTKKFGPDVYPKNFQNGSSFIGGAKLDETKPLSEQEDLMVWMRTAALPTFRKLYGRIETDLEANEKITVTIQNNYNTYSFDGKKKLVISTATWIGGKNDFLGRMYMVVGGASLLLALLFSLLYIFKPRPLGDPTYLSWNRNPTF
ncbi:hypothetical protein ACS0TY_007259 [Phlomoides rotata]